MRVEVLPDECEANAICCSIAPDVFELDDNDELHILINEVPAGEEEKLRRAINSCPKRALHER